jgi:hypothetical protein
MDEGCSTLLSRERNLTLDMGKVSSLAGRANRMSILARADTLCNHHPNVAVGTKPHDLTNDVNNYEF